MILSIFLSLFIFFILLCLIALIDNRLKTFWGFKHSTSKAILLFFTLLSLLYQFIFLLGWPFLFSVADIFGVLLCFLFFKPIFCQLKEYGDLLLWKSLKTHGVILWALYFFIAYFFFLALLGVPGMNWDEMVYHLPRPFLYLHEGGIFTHHYNDVRLVSWPMSGDILTFLFTRFDSTFGVGLIHWIFYVGILMTVYETLHDQVNAKVALTLTFITASMPVLAYAASSAKNDLHTLFTFLMMWLSFLEFRQTRKTANLFLMFVALAFGLSCKSSFLFLGPLSLAAFLWIEICAGTLKKPITGPRLAWPVWILFLIGFLFMAQTHIYVFNLWNYQSLMGDPNHLVNIAYPPSQEWVAPIRTFIKNQLMFIDFVLPVSWAGIPFVDTFLSFLYNKTAGLMTGDVAWNYQYFPEEMRAAYGPFGILALWGIYRSLFGKTERIAKVLAFVAFAWMLIPPLKTPWQPVSTLRYYAPTLIAGLIFYPCIYRSKIVSFHKTIRIICLGLLLFCCIVNYPKPLVAYNPKAVPWYADALSDRGYLYHSKYFLDDRMELYQKWIHPSDKVFVFSYVSDWVFPYYQYANGAKIRLGNYEFGKKIWSQIDFKNYDWVICNTPECIQDWDQRGDFEKVWQNPTPHNAEADFIEKTAALYRQLTPPHEKIKPLQ